MCDGNDEDGDAPRHNTMRVTINGEEVGTYAQAIPSLKHSVHHEFDGASATIVIKDTVTGQLWSTATNTGQFPVPVG